MMLGPVGGAGPDVCHLMMLGPAAAFVVGPHQLTTLLAEHAATLPTDD